MAVASLGWINKLAEHPQVGAGMVWRQGMGAPPFELRSVLCCIRPLCVSHILLSCSLTRLPAGSGSVLQAATGRPRCGRPAALCGDACWTKVQLNPGAAALSCLHAWKNC